MVSTVGQAVNVARLRAAAPEESDASSSQSPVDRAKMLEDLTAQVIEGSKPQDVEAMSAQRAKARYQQISAMQSVGAFQCMGVNATYKGEKTGDLDTYMGWLEERFAGDQSSGPQAPGAAAPRAMNSEPSADNSLADLSPTPNPEGEHGDVETSGDTRSNSARSAVGPKADDLARPEPEDRVPPVRGSTYASVVHMQAATAAASQVVAELSKMAARVQASDTPVDVAALSTEAARSQHEQLTALQRLGSPFLNVGLAAVFGDQSAFDVGKLVELLNGLGADDTQGQGAAPPSLLDFKA